MRMPKLPIVAAIALLAGTGVAAAQLSREVDQRAVCLECHDLADALSARVAHPPAAEGDCSACHNPHVARFDVLLRDQPGPLCASCHDGLAEELARPIVHAPVAEGRCADCHQPHGSANQGLLVERGAALCSTCHGEVEEWRGRRVRHAPFAQGRCQDCHEPHAAGADGLLKASGASACATCHSFDGDFRRVHGGYPVERAACSTCHDPHASSRAGLLRETVHPPFADGDCATCHAGPGGAEPFALVAAQPALCGECHADVVEASIDAPFPHVPAGGGRCTDCHNPHAGEGAAMLQRRGNQTCTACHDPGGSGSGEPGRHATHGDGLDCTTCHSPHGGDRPLLFARTPIDTCGECHSHQHGVNHPVGEGILDPRSGNPMDCGSCHGIHLAPYPKYLHAAETRDLCLSCHKSIGRRR